MNSDRLQELINAWQESSLTDAQIEELNERLRLSESDRERFQQAAGFHAFLHCAAEANSLNTISDSFDRNQRNHRRIASLATRHLTFAALAGVLAGVFVGIGFASIAWSYSSGIGEGLQRRPVEIVDSGFESGLGPLPSFFPEHSGIWSGDESEVVPAPWAAEGKHVLRLLKTGRSKSRPDGPARSCDIYQVVDLRPLQKTLGDNEGVLELSAKYATELDPGQARLEIGHHLHLFRGNVVVDSSTFPNAMFKAITHSSSYVALPVDPRPRDWQTVSSQCALPRDAEFAVIWLYFQRADPSDTSVFTLGHQYIDDVRLSLVTSPGQ